LTKIFLSVFSLACIFLNPGRVPAQEPNADPSIELRKVVERSGGIETKLIDNLEVFVREHPDYRRNDIEREIYKLAIKIRDRDRAIAYGERMIAGDNRDVETMTTVINLLRERKKSDDLKRALALTEELNQRMEAIFSAGKPGRIGQKVWNDRKDKTRASVAMLKGQVLIDLGEDSKAAAELRRSYKTSPMAETAVELARLAEKRGARDEAMDYYVQAMAQSFDTADKIDRQEIRAKLGKLWVEKTGSETGLGDRLLKAYDQAQREREEHAASLETRNINAGITDPLQFKLTRIKGGTLRLADLKGKVVVLNFWATWCGPCRVEMPLLEQAFAKYKQDDSVVFLAVNTDEDRVLVEPYLNEQKLKLPVVYADYLDDQWAVSSIPTTLILDRKGGISYRQAGFNSREDFVASLSEKIEAAKK
jgi:thiol-disulfide isomerase/thioredoxin